MLPNIIINTARVAGRKGISWLCVGVIAGVALSFFELGIALLLQQLLVLFELSTETVILPGGIPVPQLSLQMFIAALIALGIARSMSFFLIAQSSSVMNETIATRLRLMALYETLKLKEGFLSISKIHTRFGELFPKTTLYFQYLGLLMPNVFYATILFAMMLSISPTSTGVGLIGIGLIGLLVHMVNKSVRANADRLPEEYSHLTSTLTKVVKNFFLIKALRTIDQEHQKLVRSALRYATHSVRACFFANTGAAAPQVFGIFLIALLIYRQKMFGDIGNAQFLSFLYLFFRFLNNLSNMAASFGVVNVHYPSFIRTSEYFMSFTPDQKAAATSMSKNIGISGISSDLSESVEPEQSEAQRSPSNAGPEISVSNLSFSYSSTDNPVFNNLSFKVNPGDQIGIRGKSGAGKSTLMGILLGVLKTSDGNIKINGISADHYFNDPKNKLGYVGADPFLIEGSIRENLHYGSRRIYTDAECEDALRTAQLSDWINATPNGLDYLVSESGEGLSTGQKQRLSLARAILNEPSVLFLDEISANLDNRTEAEIAEMLKLIKGRCTCLIISHRDGILKFADRIIEL